MPCMCVLLCNAMFDCIQILYIAVSCTMLVFTEKTVYYYYILIILIISYLYVIIIIDDDGDEMMVG